MSEHPADCICDDCYGAVRGIFPGWWPQEDEEDA
jgi:hypothetical protein